MVRPGVLDDIARDRRRYCGSAALTLAAAQSGIAQAANAQSKRAKRAQVRAIKPREHISFAALKQIDAGLLSIA